jgi:Na+/proline symporter
MLGVTLLGHRLSGRIHDRRGFFQADGTMPWWAVSASIIATVVSAVTFVSVPAAVFAPAGNLTYFQVILGLALGKVVVARLLARPFYLSHNLATSYEYIGARIDPSTGSFSMGLGLLLNTINAGVKLLTASLVLDVISGWGLAGCAAFIVGISLGRCQNGDLDRLSVVPAFRSRGCICAALHVRRNHHDSARGLSLAGRRGQVSALRF